MLRTGEEDGEGGRMKRGCEQILVGYVQLRPPNLDPFSMEFFLKIFP